MALLIKNNAWATLPAAVLTTDTTFSVTAGQGARFPSPGAGDWFYLTFCDTSNNLEIVKITARSTDTFTMQRAVDGTIARAFAAGTRVELRPVAAWIMDVTNALITQFETGVTMTGPLNIAPGASQPLHALSKGNIDTSYIALTGNWQPDLGYVPLGIGSITLNDISLAWSSGMSVEATVDTTDIGTIWHSGNFNPASYAVAGAGNNYGNLAETASFDIGTGGVFDNGSPWLIEGFRTTGDLHTIIIRSSYLTNY
jgi:hypothetical protein